MLMAEKKQWIVSKSPPMDILKGNSITDNIFTTLLYNRDIIGEQAVNNYLNPSIDHMSDPMEINGMEKCLHYINRSIQARKPVGIFGDFDVDGLTGTTIVARAIKDMGGNTISYIPKREIDGHGVSQNGIKFFKEKGVELIVTVDTGISAVNEVKLAKSIGIDVIITDHHLPTEELPPAIAIVNPSLVKSSIFAGAGVALKVSQALFNQQGKSLPDIYMQLAAIGTIADNMLLKDENRIIVSHGISTLRNTKSPGLKALLNTSKSFKNRITTETIAFYIAPRLNAPGRLGDALPTLDLLLTDNYSKAHNIANYIEKINEQRKQLSAESELFAKEQLLTQEDQKIKFIQCTKRMSGILGPTAGRISSMIGCPVVAYIEDDGNVRASVRSIPQFDIHKALSSTPELFIRFGGHKQAAGFSTTSQKFGEVVASLKTLASWHSFSQPWANTLNIDHYVELCYIDNVLWGAVERMEPFGPGNLAPVFTANRLIASNVKTVGQNGEHLRLTLKQDNTQFNAIGFGLGSAELGSGYVDAAFSLRTDKWLGKVRQDLQIQDIQPSVI